MFDLILLRHGQSTWNELNLFTGWEDVALSEQGEREAKDAGRRIAELGQRIHIAFSSVLTRAIRTTELALEAAGARDVEIVKDWHLNERHYGELQGKDKAEIERLFGPKQFLAWRRSYDTPPPPLRDGDQRCVDPSDPLYVGVDPVTLPRTECLEDVVRRTVPYFTEVIIPELKNAAIKNEAVLVVAHGNSLRALRKHLDSTSDQDIVSLEIPTGKPYRYLLNDTLGISEAGYLSEG